MWDTFSFARENFDQIAGLCQFSERNINHRNNGPEDLCHIQRGMALPLHTCSCSKPALWRIAKPLTKAPTCREADVQQVHKLCQKSAEKILNDFKPQLMIAIGGGGYVPARILRYFKLAPTCLLAGSRCKVTHADLLKVIPQAPWRTEHPYPSHRTVPLRVARHDRRPSRGGDRHQGDAHAMA